jgi:hypothetical protein
VASDGACTVVFVLLVALREILASELGMKYFMEHCMREYSHESVLCYKAIEKHMRNTSYAGFADIYTKVCGACEKNECVRVFG